MDDSGPIISIPNSGRSTSAGTGLLYGTSPRFADETKELLRRRLFGATIAIGGILGVAFFGNVLLGNTEMWWLRLTFLLAVLSGLHTLQKPGATINRLWFLEVLTFGIFYFQLALMMVTRLIRYAAEGDVGSVAAVRFGYLAAFCVLILAYSIFVPNNWKRGAGVIILMAGLPYLICAIIAVLDSKVGAAFAQIAYKSPIPVTAMAAVVGICGVSTIYSVRREAFKAKRLGQYRLGQQLGEGGMGQVFEGEHMLLKRPCAIKLIHADVAATASVIAGFEREVKATAKLTHWNTVEIYDYGRTDEGTFYYVMELLNGCSLAEMVNGFGPLPPARAVHFLRQICEALDEAHSLDLIHRDLKPQNIFVSRMGNQYDIVKLLDFGLVKVQVSSDGEAISDSRKRIFSGTPGFMPPEQATNYDQVDGRSDIYALGCLAYFMVTGQPPFVGKKNSDILMAHARDSVVSPATLNESVTSDFNAVILKCLEKQPSDRFQNVRALSSALVACEFEAVWNDELAKDWWSTVGSSILGRAKGDTQPPSAEAATLIMSTVD